MLEREKDIRNRKIAITAGVIIAFSTAVALNVAAVATAPIIIGLMSGAIGLGLTILPFEIFTARKNKKLIYKKYDRELPVLKIEIKKVKKAIKDFENNPTLKNFEDLKLLQESIVRNYSELFYLDKWVSKRDIKKDIPKSDYDLSSEFLEIKNYEEAKNIYKKIEDRRSTFSLKRLTLQDKVEKSEKFREIDFKALNDLKKINQSETKLAAEEKNDLSKKVNEIGKVKSLEEVIQIEKQNININSSNKKDIDRKRKK